MISREKILEVIKKVPDENLDELYSIIKDFEVNATQAVAAGAGLD